MSFPVKTREEIEKEFEFFTSLADKYPEGTIMRMGKRTVVAYDMDEHWAEFEFHVPEGAANYIGTIHGGYIAAILDDSMGIVTHVFGAEGEDTVTTLDMQFSCMKAIHVGETVRVRAKLEHCGKRACIARCEMRRDGVMTSFAEETFARIPAHFVKL